MRATAFRWCFFCSSRSSRSCRLRSFTSALWPRSSSSGVGATSEQHSRGGLGAPAPQEHPTPSTRAPART